MNYDINLLKDKNTDVLKLIAIITMLVDHIGKVFFPKIIILRIIGRISFPIFAYLIALGYKRTSSYENYLSRLLMFGFLSIIPYNYFSQGNNIFFTLASGLVSILFYKKKNYIVPFTMIVLSQYINMTYGWYGVIMILIFSIFLEDLRKLTVAFLVLNFLYFLTTSSIIQMYSVFALVILPINYSLIYRLPKYLYYWFYPIHIIVLLLIKRA